MRLFVLYTYLLPVKKCEIIGQVGRVLANGPGDQGSIPDRVILKTLKMVLDTSLPNTQLYSFKYSYLIVIICTQLYGFNYFNKLSGFK